MNYYYYYNIGIHGIDILRIVREEISYVWLDLSHTMILVYIFDAIVFLKKYIFFFCFFSNFIILFFILIFIILNFF